MRIGYLTNGKGHCRVFQTFRFYVIISSHYKKVSTSLKTGKIWKRNLENGREMEFSKKTSEEIYIF